MNSWFVLSSRVWVLLATDGLTWRSEKGTDVANNIKNSSVQLKHNNGSSQFARMHNNYSLLVSVPNYLLKGEAGNGFQKSQRGRFYSGSFCHKTCYKLNECLWIHRVIQSNDNEIILTRYIQTHMHLNNSNEWILNTGPFWSWRLCGLTRILSFLISVENDVFGIMIKISIDL